MGQGGRLTAEVSGDYRSEWRLLSFARDPPNAIFGDCFEFIFKLL